MVSQAVDPQAALEESMKRLNTAMSEEQAIIDDFHEEVEQKIEERAINADPRNQQYIRRLDTGHVVESDKEFAYCREKGIPMNIMTYGQAVASVNKKASDALKDQQRKAKRKVAKKARRRNRK